MKLKIGNSALILEESKEQYRLVVDVEKLRGKAKTVLLMLLAAGCIVLFAMKWFIIASVLAFALAIIQRTDAPLACVLLKEKIRTFTPCASRTVLC